MIPETENPQEAKSFFSGKPARHAYAHPGRYFTQSPQCCFSLGAAHMYFTHHSSQVFGYLNIQTALIHVLHTPFFTRVWLSSHTDYT